MYPNRENIIYPTLSQNTLPLWTKKNNFLAQYSSEKKLTLSTLANNSTSIRLHAPQQNKHNEMSKATLAFSCVKDYCDNTSLHGFKYITNKSNYKVERILWFLLCCFTITGSAFFLYPIFSEYMQRTVTTSIASMGEPIWTIPFPAVTICNINKASRYRVLEAKRKPPWSKYAPDVVEKIIDLMTEIGQIKMGKNDTEDELVRNAVNEQGNSVDHLMKYIQQPKESMAVSCWWLNEPVNCSQIFRLRRTNEGYCWGFNSRAMKSDEEQTGSDQDSSRSENRKQFIAKRVNGAGPNMGLTVLLNPEVNDYYSYTKNIHGFKVMIHHPYDFPAISSKGFLVNAGNEIFVAVTATNTMSTQEIRKTPKAKRKCRFRDEEKLSLYSIYSYANCLLECKITSMKKNCGCVPYFYDRLLKFSSIKPPYEVEGLDSTKESMSSCTCPRACEELDYRQEVSSAHFPVFPEVVNVQKHINKTQLVFLRVYFKGLTYIQYDRDLVYSTNDLVAAFGGVVGLFMGFSFISAAEFVYFFTIRSIIRFHKH